MRKRTVTVAIDDDALSFQIGGETCFGGDEVLLASEDNLIAGTKFEPQGYTVVPFLVENDSRDLRQGLIARLGELIRQRVSSWQDEMLSRYHEVIEEEDHRQLVATVQSGLSTDELPLPVSVIEERISRVCGCDVRTRRPDTGTSKFNLRLVRPGSGDNNPPHRDVWLDHLKNAINIYFPLVGSGPRSSLPLLPASHLWSEVEIERTAEGATIDGITYRVPAVVGCRRPFRMTRPPVGENKVLVFSPYLIHGGGANFSQQTRVSLEMRFWRAEP